MMTLKLRYDLPIKYYLNLQDEPELIDNNTILFNIIQYIIKVANSKGKELSPDVFKFSSKSLKYIFGEKIKDETFKANLVKALKDLIQSGHFEVDEDIVKITTKGIEEFYIIE